LKNILEEMLQCPKCKGKLEVTFTSSGTTETGRINCISCKEEFEIHDGILYLYQEDNGKHLGRDESQIWDRKKFEETYEKIGYYQSGREFDRQLGYPDEVSDFLFNRVKRRLLSWLKPENDHLILDVGCGSGYFLFLINKRYLDEDFRPIAVGIDISETELKFMSIRKQKERLSNIIIIHGNGQNLPFNAETFDLITCSEVIEHINNPQRALNEMNRVLKKNGRLLLSTPSITAQNDWDIIFKPLSIIKRLLTTKKPSVITPESAYDVPWIDEELKEAIKNAGFRILDFEYNAIIPHPWYFKFLPRMLVKPTVFLFVLIDRYLKSIFKRLALHFVVKCSKI
jgi:ubiquinone/menaquinone biosynthesis C-methylase UbiE/uncharacterized protein YbaR (Trm112 family)